MASHLEQPEIGNISIDETYPLVEQPDNINIPLKNHQRALIHKSLEIESSSDSPISITDDYKFRTRIGIIGDKVGSGKTLSIIGLISIKRTLENTITRSDGISNMLSYEEKLCDITYSDYNIIVVPHTILNQWKNTIEKYTDLCFYCIFNKKTLQKFIEIFNNTNNTNEYKDFSNNHIILVSDTKYNNFMSLNLKFWKKGQTFSRVIFDEADSIKIPKCSHVNASFIWFVTSSYKSLIELVSNYNTYTQEYYTNFICTVAHRGFIYNTMKELQTLPIKIVRNIIIRNDNKFIEKSFNLPDIIINTIKCKQPYHINILGNSIPSNVINHLNAGDIEGAIDHFSCSRIKETNLVQVVTKSLCKTLHNLELEIEMKSKMVYNNDKHKEETLNKIIVKMEECKNKIKGIQEKIASSTQCSICYDDLKNTTLAPCCKTKYCFECISKWHFINNKCPFCRKIIVSSELIVISNKKIKFSVKKKDLDKIDNLRIIIENGIKKPDFKLLIFSEFNNSFNKMISLLEEFNLSYSRVLGSIYNINKVIDNYKSSDENKIDVLMLNSKYCGSGINLENTTDIVLFHSMDKDRTEQIIGRGQRPGRTNQLNVWKLSYSNEILYI